jgi:hypothetical protein
VQHIRLPDTVEGNGYVVVSFVRDLASRDIFVSPLTSGAAPFSVSRSRHTQALTLDVPERVAPGTSPAHRLERRRADPPRDLRGGRGHPPGRALEDARSALVLLPQALPGGHHRRRSSTCCSPSTRSCARSPRPGGDDDALLAGNLNPFKRKGIPPVAYWSGIRDVPAGAGGVDYAIPDTFNGSLRVLAVGVNDRAVGIAETRTIARGPVRHPADAADLRRAGRRARRDGADHQHRRGQRSRRPRCRRRSPCRPASRSSATRRRR